MAKAEYIVSLIRSHYNDEPERFTTLALQIVAQEANLGHPVVADEIKKLLIKQKLIFPKIRYLIQKYRDLL
jgi:hypothetical protein